MSVEMKTTLDRTKLQEHKYSGNGFVITADIADHPGYCYVTKLVKGYTGKLSLDSQFLVARNDMLSVDRTAKEPMLDSEVIQMLDLVRHKIEFGTHKIVNTRLVEVK